MTLKVSRSFRPTPLGTIVLLSLAIVFAGLGTWQSKRATQKAEFERQHKEAGQVALAQALARDDRFARVDAVGSYDPHRHILLDNQMLKGHVGVHVFTPFNTLSGKTILVNRGWLPLSADRKSLPDIPTPQHEIELRGILNTFPVPGRMLGEADRLHNDQWPQLVTYLIHDDIAHALDVSLEGWVIQLADTEASGFDGRDWKPVFLTSQKHRGYAFQWYALALIAIVLWVFYSYRKTGINRR